jgi:hypothetical protein
VLVEAATAAAIAEQGAGEVIADVELAVAAAPERAVSRRQRRRR